ncbi:hypothetical protein [Herbaspirillum sp.]|uniref:hypothetical protein n=1 Tax=Herbaspirillum sp. TaxID=1890675 RepID=UPI0031E46EA4
MAAIVMACAGPDKGLLAKSLKFKKLTKSIYLDFDFRLKLFLWRYRKIFDRRKKAVCNRDETLCAEASSRFDRLLRRRGKRGCRKLTTNEMDFQVVIKPKFFVPTLRFRSVVRKMNL